MITRNVKIAPSILSADFARLGEEIAAITAGGADYVHVDVMDGHFVPNLTIGPVVISSLKKHAKIPLDVHLMIAPVDGYIESYAKAGAQIITVHAEATTHLHRTLQHVRAQGVKVGVSLVPSTPETALEYVLQDVDLILVMTVNPGFGGQTLIESQYEKIRRLRKTIDASGRTIELQVDGGVNRENAAKLVAAGADVLVAGSAVFTGNTADYAANIKALRGN